MNSATTAVIGLPADSRRFGDATAHYEWISPAVDTSEPAISGGTLALLPAHAAVILVAPNQCLSWHALKVPRIAAARLRQALAGALEDRLLDTPEQLNLALQPQARAGHNSWVATCQKDWLAAAVTAFEQAGHPVIRVVPEIAPLPLADDVEVPDSSSAILEVSPASDATVLVGGTEEAPQVTLAGTNAPLSLPLATTPLSWQQLAAKPEVRFVAEPAVAGVAERWAGRPAVVRTKAQAWIEASASPWNLAQMDVIPRRNRPWGDRLSDAAWTFWHAREWRPARLGLMLLVISSLGVLNATAWHTRRELAATEDAITREFTQAFPKAGLVVDAPRQMTNELQRLRLRAGVALPGDFAPMMQALADTWPEGAAPASHIVYDSDAGGVLTVQAGNDTSAFPRATPALSERGYTTQTQDGRLVIHAAPEPADEGSTAP